jgi:hypothetical protein
MHLLREALREAAARRRVVHVRLDFRTNTAKPMAPRSASVSIENGLRMRWVDSEVW